MEDKGNYANAVAALAIATIICVAPAVFLFFGSSSSFLSSIAHLWPKYSQLDAHCETSTCVFRPAFVAFVYISNVAVPIATFLIVSVLGWGRIPSRRTLLVRSTVVIVLALFSVLLVLFPLDFETDRFALHENSVSWSYLGITRAFWPAWLSAFLSITFYSSDMRSQRGSSR